MAVWITHRSNAIPRRAADEIATLVKYADQIDAVVDASKKEEPSTSTAEVLVKLSKRVDFDVSALEGIFSALENLKNLSIEFGGVDKTIDQVAKGLEGPAAHELLAKRQKIAAAVENYPLDNAVAISTKAQRLTYLRENIYQEAEIITDARPVFDSKGETIIEHLITHSLVVTYFHRGQFENIHLTMDAGDVVKLRRACDRAFIKAQTLKTELGEKARILRDDDATTSS